MHFSSLLSNFVVENLVEPPQKEEGNQLNENPIKPDNNFDLSKGKDKNGNEFFLQNLQKDLEKPRKGFQTLV